MRTPVLSSKFRRDVKRLEKRGKDMRKLRAAITILIEELPLPASYLDHPLRGNWHGFRDMHIEPDWLMIYRIVGQEVQFARSGTHGDLFDE